MKIFSDMKCQDSAYLAPYMGKKLVNARLAQRGVSLIVVLMLLVIVSLLGVASMQIVMMGERAARSDRDMQLAWQGAEAALVDAEIELTGPNNFAGARTANILATGPIVSVGCNTSTGSDGWRGFCSLESGENYDSNGPRKGSPKPTWLTVDFTDTGATAPSIAVGTFTGRNFSSADAAMGRGIQPALAPRYVIEYIPPNLDPWNSSGGMTTPRYQSAGDAKSNNAAGSLYRITGTGFGPRSDIQAVLQTVYRH